MSLPPYPLLQQCDGAVYTASSATIRKNLPAAGRSVEIDLCPVPVVVKVATLDRVRSKIGIKQPGGAPPPQRVLSRSAYP